MFTGYYAIRDTCIWRVLRKLPITFAYSLWCHLLKFGQTVAINHVRLICITWCVTSERHIAQLCRPVARLSEGLRQNWLLNTSVGEGTEESGVTSQRKTNVGSRDREKLNDWNNEGKWKQRKMSECWTFKTMIDEGKRTKQNKMFEKEKKKLD